MSGVNKVCPTCGGTLNEKPKKNKYCSRACQHKSMIGKKLKNETIEKMKSTRRKKSKFYKYTKAQYRYLYWNCDMSIYQIAKKLCLTPQGLYAHLKMVGLKMRPQKQSMKKGDKSPYWRGGIYISSSGYLRKTDGTALHRVIAESVLGRKLTRGEVVHHVDENRTNNNKNNLLICTRSYHTYLHRMDDIKNNKPLFGRSVKCQTA